MPIHPIQALIAALAVSTTALAAGVPLTLNTNGFLLDGADHPVTQQGVSLKFSIWSDPSSPLAASRIWPTAGESECLADVSNGFYAVTLDGSQATGCGALLSSNHVEDGQLRYLQVSVGGVALSPRLRLGSVPLAAFATQSADTQALATALSTPGTLNDAENPVEWSRLKSVPGGFADGVDADTTYTAAPTGGLSLGGTAFSIANGGVTNVMLANPSVTVTAGTGLTGGGAAALGGATTLGLANTAVIPNSYTLANITVDAQGRLTAASSGSVTVSNAMLENASVTVTAGTGLTGGGAAALGGATTLGLANTAVTPNSYTLANITVDAQGRITAASNGSVQNGLQLLPSRPGSPASGTFIFNTTNKLLEVWDGANWHSFASLPPLVSCKAILDAGRSAGDGVYLIQPDGSPAFQVWCRMGGDYPGATLVIRRPGSVAGQETIAGDLGSTCTPDTSGYCKLSDAKINAIKAHSSSVDPFIILSYKSAGGAPFCRGFVRKACQWISNSSAGTSCENAVTRNSGQYCSRNQVNTDYRGVDGHTCGNLTYPGVTSPSNPFVIFEHSGGDHYCGGWDNAWDHIEMLIQ